MKQRCFDKNTTDFAYYGERGITVCERWMIFENFYEDMGPRPKGLTLERIDNAKSYSPDNCRWASRREQCVNRSMTRWLTFKGETLCMDDWARRYGLRKQNIWTRLNAGWSVAKAITTPVQS